MKAPLSALCAAVLLCACQKDAPEAARQELEKRHIVPDPGALVIAAREGDVDRLRLLLLSGVDPGLAGPDGETALGAALAEGRSEAVEVLVREGGNRVLEGPARAAILPPSGQTALGWALARRQTGVVAGLLKNGTDPNKPLVTPAGPAFLQAVGDGSLDYYLRREQGVTPLMLASATGQLEAARLLLEAGADPGAETRRHKTEAIWLAGRNQHTAVVRLLLGKDPSDQSLLVRVDLRRQRATLYRDGNPVDSSPVSTGRPGFQTPKGSYVVTNKYRDWKSTLYEDAPMPFFMRLSCGDFGLHAGVLPGYPASHGCIRMPYEKARAFFSKVEVGTLVEIVD
ncbi:MAG: L,D-transpeptidase family protein [Candidatus Methylacidiphilales bacterium]|nr:L,D-transpeptidase family protein [Candidatus Methylacidiphilales bacterium]